jgi:hypothetical protein
LVSDERRSGAKSYGIRRDRRAVLFWSNDIKMEGGDIQFSGM